MEVSNYVDTQKCGFQLAWIKGSHLNPPMSALSPWKSMEYKSCTLLLENNAAACLVVSSPEEQEQL